MLVDANVLLFATDTTSPNHDRCASWLIEALSGDRRVGLPWQSIGAFVRISTHPRILSNPLSAASAWEIVEGWLAQPTAWIPAASERTAANLGELLRVTGATGNLIPDAQLAALAIEHGLEVVSADSDFARFPSVRWLNPIR